MPGNLNKDRLAEHGSCVSCVSWPTKGGEHRRDVTDGANRAGPPLADPTRPYGVLVVESTRLMEEFQHACDVLERYVDGKA